MTKRDNGIDTYKIGRIGRPHGVQGELNFSFDDDIFDSDEAEDYLFLIIDGLPVPFFIESYRFRGDYDAIIKFEGIDDRDYAATFTGCEVHYPGNKTHLVIGCEVISDGQVIGRIASVDDSTANTLFVLEDGKLIPAADDLIEDIDITNKKIWMSLPEGLI